MAHPALARTPEVAFAADSAVPRHTGMVRATHWISAICFVALLITGVEILISHPRFYWGETGNVNTPALFKIPIPASRAMVPTGYGYMLPDQNGWSRALHFQAAWLVVPTGLVYLVLGLRKRHFSKNVLPGKSDLSWPSLSASISSHLRFERPGESEAWTYNPLQKISYAFVIFLLFPLVVWTGLAMSPAFVSMLPVTVTVFGGQQSARTIHFFVSLFLFLFLFIHIAMIFLAGFRSRMRAMITGRAASQ